MKRIQVMYLYFLVAFVSVLFSVQIIATHPYLSSDSVLYLRTAEAFVNVGLSGALGLYSWPLLSIVIAYIHSIFGISFELSAYILSALLYILLCCTFIGIVRELGGSVRSQYLSAFIILTFPTLNEYRDYIIRDHGYWTFLLLSIFYLLRYRRVGDWRNALGWGISSVVAFGFRVEGLALLALVPLCLCFRAGEGLRTRLISMSRLYVVAALIALFITIPLLMSEEPLSGNRIVAEFIRAPEIFTNIYHDFIQTADTIAKSLSNHYLSKDIELVFVSGLLALLVYHAIHAFMPLNLLLLFLGRYWVGNKNILPASSVLFGYLAVISLYLLFALFSRQFMNDRFMVPLCLILLLWLPFCVDAIIEKFSAQNLRWPLVLLGVVMSYPLFDSLISTGTSKHQIDNALKWLNANMTEDTRMLTNNAHLAYFSKQEFDGCTYSWKPVRTFAMKPCRDRTLLVIDIGQKDYNLQANLNKLKKRKLFQVIKRFSNDKKDEIIILERKK